jgi:Uma2 family endonuclease
MSVLPRGREWTVDDLRDLPDDGLRYELVDGVLLVSAAPSNLHQVVVGELHVLLRAACPADARVMLAPTDYQPTQRRSLQPDLLVARRADVGREPISAALLLAVEVLSPSTRSVDRLLKHGVYAESGVASYWVVDPLVPSVEVWRLEDGSYEAAGSATGDEELRVDEPFPVSLVPSALLDGMPPV